MFCVVCMCIPVWEQDISPTLAANQADDMYLVHSCTINRWNTANTNDNHGHVVKWQWWESYITVFTSHNVTVIGASKCYVWPCISLVHFLHILAHSVWHYVLYIILLLQIYGSDQPNGSKQRYIILLCKKHGVILGSSDCNAHFILKTLYQLWNLHQHATTIVSSHLHMWNKIKQMQKHFFISEKGHSNRKCTQKTWFSSNT